MDIYPFVIVCIKITLYFDRYTKNVYKINRQRFKIEYRLNINNLMKKKICIYMYTVKY